MTKTPEQHTVQVGPITTKYLKAGEGDPLLYLHGAFGYDGWPEFLDLLSQSFTVYAPLHPGFEGDDGLDHIEDLLDLTLYHDDLIGALGLGAPHVVGHYSGAMVAAEMAVLCSCNLGKIVLAAPAGLWQDDNPGRDYNTTPITEMRQALFADPDSDVALSVYPQPKGRRGTRLADNPPRPVAKRGRQIPVAHTRQGIDKTRPPHKEPDPGHSRRRRPDSAARLRRNAHLAHPRLQVSDNARLRPHVPPRTPIGVRKDRDRVPLLISYRGTTGSVSLEGYPDV